MPYQWIEPELFMEFAGVAIYHCYDDSGQVSRFWYTLDISDDNIDWPSSDTEQFDVRDLPDLGLNAYDVDNHAAIIRQAIQAGLISGQPAHTTEPARSVKIEVIGGVAHVLDKPAGLKVEIIDRDQPGKE